MLAKPVVEIAPRTWLISEYKLVNMYLLEGDEAALLIDCGTGIGNAAETCLLYTSWTGRGPRGGAPFHSRPKGKSADAFALGLACLLYTSRCV